MKIFKKKAKAVKAGRKSPRKSTRASNVRTPEQTSRGEDLIVGIDPANETSGLCVLNSENESIWCGTLSVWAPLPEHFITALSAYLGTSVGRAKIFYERSPVRGKPANDAISRAAGMLIERLHEMFFKSLKRSDVTAVEPATWRVHTYGTGRPADPKLMAILEYRKATNQEPETHDAAEAFFIARYGAFVEWGKRGVGK